MKERLTKIKNKWYSFLAAYVRNPLSTIMFTYGCICVFAGILAIVTSVAKYPAVIYAILIGFVLLGISLYDMFWRNK